MHKPLTRGVASAFAVAAVSVGLISGAVGSNGISSITAQPSYLIRSQTAVATVTHAQTNLAGVDQEISGLPTATLAVHKKVRSSKQKKVTTYSASWFKPKPVALKPVPVPIVGGAKTISVDVTFYGAYDNDPAGSREISNGVIHKEASGVGSYADPLTFASPAGTGAYPVGTKIYVPFLQKYFIREDVCGVSWTATSGCGAVSHVDLYMGNPSDSSGVLICEDALTPVGNAAIIVNPASNLPYDATPLWNQTTGACAKTH